MLSLLLLLLGLLVVSTVAAATTATTTTSTPSSQPGSVSSLSGVKATRVYLGALGLKYVEADLLAFPLTPLPLLFRFPELLYHCFSPARTTPHAKPVNYVNHLKLADVLYSLDDMVILSRQCFCFPFCPLFAQFGAQSLPPKNASSGAVAVDEL